MTDEFHAFLRVSIRAACEGGDVMDMITGGFIEVSIRAACEGGDNKTT